MVFSFTVFTLTSQANSDVSTIFMIKHEQNIYMKRINEVYVLYK